MYILEKIIEYTSRSDIFTFYPLSDFHRGSIDSIEDDSNDKINECLNRDNSYVFGLGDMAECITKNDPRFSANGLAPWVLKSNIVESERDNVVESFKRLAKEGKIICLGTGNHEEEIHMRHDNDITRNICKDLGVTYAGYQYQIVLKFKRDNSADVHQFIIHCWHGAGAAQSDGAQTMRLMQLVRGIEADIYCMGHLHAVKIVSPDKLTLAKYKIKSRELLAMITGSWVRGYTQPKEGVDIDPNYVEKKGYNPSRIGCPIIRISPDDNQFWAETPHDIKWTQRDNGNK